MGIGTNIIPLGPAASIPTYRKARMLLKLTQDELETRVVVPLFGRQGFKRVTQETRTDILIFVASDPIGIPTIYAIVPFSGMLNPSNVKTKGSEVIKLLAQSASSKFRYSDSGERKPPTKVLLCSNGRINATARRDIVAAVNDPRVDFLDSQYLIPKIDEIIPEIWFELHSETLPYYRNLQEVLQDPKETLGIADVLPGSDIQSAVTDEMFVSLRLFRPIVKIKNEDGKSVRIPDIEEFPATDLLRRPDRMCIIVGEAGSGKSTVLRRLAYMTAEKGLQSTDQASIPVLLRATDIAQAAAAQLLDLCVQSVATISPPTSAPLGVNELTESGITLFVDALDEVQNDDQKNDVINRVNLFLEANSKHRVVVASRNLAFVRQLDALKGYKEYTLSALDFKQTEQIIKRLQKQRGLPPERSQELLRRLQEVHGIELNPLLVTVFAATSEFTRKDVPANITELFKKYTEIMLGRWDATKGLSHQYHAPLKDFLLKKLAYKMHGDNRTHLSYDEVRTFVNVELSERGLEPDTERLLDEILNRSGLFRVMGDSVEFRHLLIQEFFAGRGIPAIDTLVQYVGDDWWQRATVFYFGENPGDSDGLAFLRSLTEKQTGDRLFKAAATLGIALQACYLVRVEDKVKTMVTVVQSLAQSKDHFLEKVGRQDTFPLNRFLLYYLFGRDAVACSLIENNLTDIQKGFAQGAQGEESDLQTFWLIVGLMESGSLKAAEKMCKEFKPADSRLLLGIYLGCIMIQHLRVTTKDEKRIAGDLRLYLGQQVDYLRKTLLQELRTELLEVRQGKIEFIEA